MPQGDFLEDLIKELIEYGLTFAQGLSDSQVRKIERENDFRFPPDLNSFLHRGVPISFRRTVAGQEKLDIDDRFPNWHEDAKAIMTRSHEYIFEGIEFDIEFNSFWLEEWGTRPSDLHSASAVAKKAFEEAPPMIPVYGHRFMPGEPELAGNPVFSIVQTDIIYYGHDLVSYLYNEFSGQEYFVDWSRIRPIRFWSQLVS
jgi:hypothetical protein